MHRIGIGNCKHRRYDGGYSGEVKGEFHVL
jgi:hypothetical protein